MGLSTKLALLALVWTALFAAFAAVSFRTVAQVKVNGPMYAEIVQGKDLIADVLPPPEYLVESYLMVLQLADETDPAKIDALVRRGDALRDEYEARHTFWADTLPEGALRQTLIETSYTPAMDFFATRDGAYIPAIRDGDLPRAMAARARIAADYEQHRAAIDDVVGMANRRNGEVEAAAQQVLFNDNLLLLVIGAAVLLFGLGIGALTLQIAGSLTRQIESATDVATRVAAGDLTLRVASSGDDDEAGRLLRAIQHMSQGLNTLVAGVKQASIELMSTATELNATSVQQEATVAGFGASTSEIAAAVKEISATSQELRSTMEDVNGVASQTAELAKHGRGGLTGMDDTMRQLAAATESISGRLAVIREKAADINVVVVTITKVADQTNLLSINAAIEAEKAGEYGRGFLVVAREIRRLADQTAVATLNIEQMVRQMHAAVSAGVMEMDKFSVEVRTGVQTVGEIGGQLGQIIEQVEALSERFDVVNEGMRSQSQGARQISDAMVQLTDGARQTAGSLGEFNRATDHLRAAVGTLKREISHFKVE